MIRYILFIPLLVIVFALFSMLRNKVLAKMSFKNIFRKKKQAFLMIMGSMIGTAFIVGAMGLNDSFNSYVYNYVDSNLGEIDEVISSAEGFSLEEADSFISSLSEQSLTDGHILSCMSNYAVGKKGSIRTLNIAKVTQATIIGFDYEAAQSFGTDKPEVPQKLYDISGMQALITKDLAEKLDVKKGDSIELLDSSNPLYILLPPTFTVVDVLSEKGLFNYREEGGFISGSIFVSLPTARRFAKLNDDYFSHIIISNTGDSLKGDKLTDRIRQATKEFSASIPEKKITQRYLKSEQLRAVTGNGISLVFIILSSFAIIAGAVLITNMYDMLVQERKSELGIMRAIGFTRSWIRKVMFYEGFFYSLFSLPVGIAFGTLVSLFTFSKVNVLGDQFSTFEFTSGSIPVMSSYSISLESMITGGILGMMIPLLIIVLGSSKISRLNISDSIRNISDSHEKQKKLEFFLWFVLIISIPFIFFKNPSIRYAAVSIFIFMLPYTVLKKISKYSLNLSVLAVIAFTLAFRSEGIILAGLKALIVLIAVILLFVYNFKPLERIITFLIKLITRKSTRATPIMRIAFSYPSFNKKRTSLTTVLYGMVIFVIVIITIIPYSQTQRLAKSRNELLGGNDGFVISLPFLPSRNRPDVSKISETQGISNVSQFGFVMTQDSEGESYPLILLSDDLIDSSHIDSKFSSISSEFKKLSEREVWDLLKTHSDYTIVKSLPGSKLKVDQSISLKVNEFDFSSASQLKPSDTAQTINLRVIAIVSQANNSPIVGPVVSERSVMGMIDQSKIITGFLFKVSDTSRETYKNISNSFKINDYLFIFVDDIIDFVSKITAGAVDILSSFLYFGLVVGILGISVTTIKSIEERRNAIGMLKSIGFTSRMVFWSFFLETSFIIVMGILIGVLAGSIASYEIYTQILKDSAQYFMIPYSKLLGMSAVFYLISIIFTYFPCRQASKISPAEAMRYYE